MKTTLKFILAALTAIMLIATIFSGNEENEPDTRTFSETNQKAEWLAEYRNSDRAYVLASELQNRIKAQFKHPEEVKIEKDYAIVAHAKIRDTTKGVFFNNGYCYAKNAFGVKSKCYWETEFVLTDAEARINFLNVTPLDGD